MAQEKICLVVVGSEAETRAALHYAHKLAERMGGVVGLFGVAEEPQAMYWLAVQDASMEERKEKLEQHMSALSHAFQKGEGKTPIVYLREGRLDTCLAQFLDEESRVAALVLGPRLGAGHMAASLVADTYEKRKKKTAIPVIMIPSDMKQQDIDMMV
ncbi:MAG: universal stress protein [Alphaproteobacteria bacterium GM7ARS4]|nr:universal stress protein [Alphaproteobacteria bacterium GM7ARS4]